MRHILLLTLALVLFVALFFYSTTCTDQDILETIDAQPIAANAPSQDVLSPRTIFKNRCQPCHGINAQNHALSTSDIINTWNKQQLIDALLEYKKGARDKKGMGKMMHGQTMTLSDKEITDLANYITTLRQ